jgi:hypothetical protein
MAYTGRGRDGWHLILALLVIAGLALYVYLNPGIETRIANLFVSDS